MSSTSINRKLIEQSISKNAKKIIAASGMNPSTRSGSKELDHAVKRLAQQPFASLTAAVQVGEELGRRIVELSQQMGKQNLDGGIIRQLMLKQLPSVDASLVDSRPVMSPPLVEGDGGDVSDLQVSEAEDESEDNPVESGSDLEEPKEGRSLTAEQASEAVEPEVEPEEDEPEASIAVEVDEVDNETDDAIEEILDELDDDLAEESLAETDLVDSGSGSLEDDLDDLADEEVAEEMAVAEGSDDADDDLVERSVEAEVDAAVAETDEAETDEAETDETEIDEAETDEMAAVETDTAAVDETEIDAATDAAVAETDEAAVNPAEADGVEAALDDMEEDVEAGVTAGELDDAAVAEEPLTEATVAEPESQDPETESETEPETRPVKAAK